MQNMLLCIGLGNFHETYVPHTGGIILIPLKNGIIVLYLP